MAKGQAFDVEVTKELNETEIKKESETTRTVIWTPEAGKRFRLCGWTLFASAETAITLEDGTTAFFSFALPAKGGIVIDLATLPTSGYLSKVVANKLQLKSLNTAKFTGTFYGIEDVA